MAGLTFETSILTSTDVSHKAIAQWQIKVEGLDVTLDDAAGYADGF